MKLHPYVNFDGTCAEAMRFYAQVLGGTIEMMQTFGESPMAAQTPPEMKDRVMHARLVAGDVVIMASDGMPQHIAKPDGYYLSVHVDTAAEGKRLFDALADGGSVQMPFESTFWSPGFGMLSDRYGTPWMINVNAPSEPAAPA